MLSHKYPPPLTQQNFETTQSRQKRLVHVIVVI